MFKHHAMKMQEDEVCGHMWQTFLGRKNHMYPKTRRMGGPTGRCRSDDHGENPRLCRKPNAGRLDSKPLLSRAHKIHPGGWVGQRAGVEVMTKEKIPTSAGN